MKILFYTNSFFPDPIGIAFYNAEWVEALQAQGHEIEIVTALPYYPQWRIAAGYRGRWRVEETYRGMRVTRTWVYVPRRQRAFGRFLCELSFMLSSLPVLLGRKADLVIAVSPPFGVGLAAAVTRWLRGVPVWLHLQDLQIEAGEAVGFFRRPWLLKALRSLERWVFDHVSLVSTITEAMRERVAGKGIPAKEIALFPNWVDDRAMTPGVKKNSFRESLGVGDAFIVLYSGSIGIHQGLDFLLDAARALEGNRDIIFVVAGEGNYKETFARRLAESRLENVRLLPLQPKERLAEMLSAADVGVVMETRQMANLSMPSKVLNQMACGRTVVAVTSPETALARMIERSGAGVVVPPANAQALAMTLVRLAHAPDKTEAMGRAAREYIMAEAAKDRLLGGLSDKLRLATEHPRRPYREYLWKRPLDIFLALLGFLVSSPFWIVLSITVRLTDWGPIFFRQTRVGRYGRPFVVYKFRSMHKMELPEFDRRQARRGDPRITRIGRWMRATALDEIPQLWSILKGDMSFVGPRALMPEEVEVRAETLGAVPLERVHGFEERCLMRPGLTGIAQVYAARDVSRRNKFRYDRLYLTRGALWLDIVLILRSGWNTLTARWDRIGKASPSVGARSRAA